MEGVVLQKSLCRECCMSPAPLLLALHHDGRRARLERGLAHARPAGRGLVRYRRSRGAQRNLP
eukprot:127750-Heterocapsa_arctica.AAC.1